MSATIRTETTIIASPDTVWGVLTDFARFGEWNPFMDRAEGRAEVGEKLTIHMQPKGGRGMTFKPRVLVAEPGHELRWLGKLGPGGLFDGEHDFGLTELPDGSTRAHPGGALPRNPRWRHGRHPEAHRGVLSGSERCLEGPCRDRMTARQREIVDAARAIIEVDGGEALTMQRLAASLGIRASSLYKHSRTSPPSRPPSRSKRSASRPTFSKAPGLTSAHSQLPTGDDEHSPAFRHARRSLRRAARSRRLA
jgi:hypothetical protein